MGHQAALRRNQNPGPALENRRKEPRFAANGQVNYLPTRAAKDWRFLSGRLLDCSAHGIGLECAQPMELGDDFLLKIRMGKTRLAVYRVLDVRNWSGGYRVGAEFIGLLVDADEVDHDAIVASLTIDPRQENAPLGRSK